MNYLKFLLLTVAIGVSSFSFSQTGVVNIQIEPQDAIIKLDNIKVDENPSQQKVKIGDHIIQVWAPKRELYVRTFTVKTDTTIGVFRSLRPSEEYVKYSKELTKYKFDKIIVNSKNSVKYIATAVTLGYLVYFISNSNSQSKKYENQAEQDFSSAKYEQSLYAKSNSLNDLQTHRDKFNQHYSNYQSDVKNANYYKAGYIYQSIGVTALLAGVSYYLWRKKDIAMPEKPTFNETPKLLSKLRLKFDYLPIYSQVSFTLNCSL